MKKYEINFPVIIFSPCAASTFVHTSILIIKRISEAIKYIYILTVKIIGIGNSFIVDSNQNLTQNAYLPTTEYNLNSNPVYLKKILLRVDQKPVDLNSKISVLKIPIHPIQPCIDMTKSDTGTIDNFCATNSEQKRLSSNNNINIITK